MRDLGRKNTVSVSKGPAVVHTDECGSVDALTADSSLFSSVLLREKKGRKFQVIGMVPSWSGRGVFVSLSLSLSVYLSDTGMERGMCVCVLFFFFFY